MTCFFQTCIPRFKAAVWTFNPLGPIEVHYMEKILDFKFS